MKQTRGEKIFNGFNVAFLTVVCILMLYPFVYTVSISLSTAAEANRDSLHLYPKEVSLEAYRLVLSSPEIVTGYVNTIARTLLGTLLTLLMTCLAAYPLSRKDMPHRSMNTFLVLFTMIFGGGMVPLYLVVRCLGMLNSIWALVLPVTLSAFNVIVVRNFFRQIPESLHEAAAIDGASEFFILAKVYVPLSKPVLATVSLWTAVLHWNQWFDAMLYISDDRGQVLQNFLQRIVIEGSTWMVDSGMADAGLLKTTPETIKAATVVVTILPILLVYPFLQKYFVKGIMLAA